jgi:ATP-binding cassette subfamily B (MDR/TAP) protein 1
MCLLKKSFYGLEQSLRQWYKRFDTLILRHNYFRSENDNFVYFEKVLDSLFIYLLLYVDDMMIASKNLSEINSLKD